MGRTDWKAAARKKGRRIERWLGVTYVQRA
jgi:hypothetical protein